MTTLISEYGKHDQKGIVLGIFRSIGALARAVGPIFASIGKIIVKNDIKQFEDYDVKSFDIDFGGEL